MIIISGARLDPLFSAALHSNRLDLELGPLERSPSPAEGNVFLCVMFPSSKNPAMHLRAQA